MLHSQADIALEAFSVHTAKQKKSQIKPVTMVAPRYKLWLTARFHWQLHNALRATASRTNVVKLETGCLIMLYIMYICT